MLKLISFLRRIAALVLDVACCCRCSIVYVSVCLRVFISNVSTTQTDGGWYLPKGSGSFGTSPGPLQ